MEAYKIHDLMVKEGERLELPKAYKNDLYYHDPHDPCKSGTQHFIWVLRTNGTHIIKLDQHAPHSEVYQLVQAIKGMDNQDMHWYEFVGGVLNKITVDDAKGVAARY